MILAFTLSMPRNNSWNGRWSGDERLYAITKTFSGKKKEAKAAELIARGRYRYGFGDGWVAAIDVKQVDAAEARRLRSKSNGFCGYDWMVRSILDYGDIFNDQQIDEIHARRRAEKEAKACQASSI